MRVHRRRAIVAVVSVMGIIVALVVLERRTDTGEDKNLLPAETFMTAYRIVYEVQEFGSEARIEERLVKRPYLSKTVSTRNGTELAGSITNALGRWTLLPDGQGWQLHAHGKQRPADDPQPIDALEAAASDGRAESRGTDNVIGRRCTIVRTGGPLGSALVKPTAEEYADLCIDRTGAVLRERWMLNGSLARSTMATAFAPDALLRDEEFDPLPMAPPLPNGAPGVPTVRALDPQESPPVDVRAVADYVADGPALAVERQLGNRGPELRYSQSFVKGSRLMVAQQGTVSTGFVPLGDPIELGNGFTGYLDLGLNSSEITIAVRSDIALRLRGAELSALKAFGRDVAERLG